MNFYDVLAAKNWDGGIPTINFFDLLFAQFVSGEAWETYEGTLPATINANGNDMKQYQVYGNIGGVGDRTRNLWDESYRGFAITTTVHYEPIYVGSGEFTLSTGMPFYGTFADLFFLSGNVSTGASSATNSVYLGQSRTVQAIDGYVTIAYRQYDSAYPDVRNYHTMLTESSTAPASYVPFGYEVPIGVSDGTNTTVTPIYIGDTALQKDEYADFEAGKIYRMSGGTLTPTDPPVALPTLPTVEGETIVDYAGAKTETTKNILPSAQAQTLTVNGNTCTCDGQGRYHVDMNNNTDTDFAFSIPNFTIPISVGQGGNGTWSMFNTAAQSMQVKLYYNDTEIDYWSISAANRTSDSYLSMGGKTINKIIINAWNASVDGDFAFMFTDDGVLPAAFVPHEIAKPTPEKVLFEYKKG